MNITGQNWPLPSVGNHARAKMPSTNIEGAETTETNESIYGLDGSRRAVLSVLCELELPISRGCRRLVHYQEGGLEAVVDLQLVEDVREMSLNGFLADENPFRDFVVR